MPRLPSAARNPGLLLLGHRGARSVREIPENTFASFDRALDDGCHGFEFDVRLTADLEAVICHDPKVHGLEIAKSGSGDLSMLPRLRDVLARYRDVFLDIELKVPGLEKAAIDEVREHRVERFVISSFLPEVLHAAHELDPAVALGLICETSDELRGWKQIPVAYLMPHRKLVRKRLVSELHDAGKKLLAWTVNEAEEMTRFAEWGVDGVISDNTKLLTATLG